MKRQLIIILFLIFLLSCSPYIWFKVPQPEGLENLPYFSNDIIGKYQEISDTLILRIEQDRIIREYRENMIMSKIEFRDEVGDTISEDTSFTFADNWHVTIKSYGDSVKVFSKKDQELFKISNDQILRWYRGYYFLNERDTNNYWKVKVLRIEGDTLEYDHFLSEDDIKNMHKITSIEVLNDTAEDITAYYLKPTKREIKKMLKRRLSGEKYAKIKF